VAQVVIPPRLISLLSTWGADEPAVRAAATDLVVRYAEPHRRYHAAEHIEEMLEVTDRLGATDEVTCAVWFHDVIYDPIRDDNEARSAGYARQALTSLGATGGFADEVARLVESTRLHDPLAGDRNGQALCDADLAILGAPADRYERYVRDVRAEYVHVSDDEWQAGRTRVLEHFLARPTLFFAQEVRDACDAQARTNLRAELTSLSAS